MIPARTGKEREGAKAAARRKIRRFSPPLHHAGRLIGEAKCPTPSGREMPCRMQQSGPGSAPVSAPTKPPEKHLEAMHLTIDLFTQSPGSAQKMDWFPIVFIAFKVIVLGTGMFLAIKWHHDQGKKKKK
ncbi:hypothetical protein AVMA1855_13055 [Acidovorax sp. SUPP1855]|uniref:hypothetical protein n=1 Tax=Acidovorax sp. SUPP1855 TaxID=431774 RepID=UPI0023DE205A|nr:hypothetical protein [Acidovorax sp. SUPP1855]GKS85085.1 hypothetical protein AVMA1855_13055 [Acidovorax sp. SUPP1855]